MCCFNYFKPLKSPTELASTSPEIMLINIYNNTKTAGMDKILKIVLTTLKVIVEILMLFVLGLLF